MSDQPPEDLGTTAAAWLRLGEPPGRGRRTTWLCSRPRDRSGGLPVRFEITEQTCQAIDEHLAATRKRPGDFLFNGRGGKGRCLSTRQYARLLSNWIASIGLDPSLFGTHSLRRTKATLIYRRTRGRGVTLCPPRIGRSYLCVLTTPVPASLAHFRDAIGDGAMDGVGPEALSV